MTDAAAQRKNELTLAQPGGFTAPQKAALILAALGPEAAKPVVERVGDKHLQAFAEAYAHLRNIPRKELLAVAAEFVAQLGAGDERLKGGFDEARDLISKVKSPDEATRLLDEVNAPGGRTVWQKLERADRKAFAAYLNAQHPQTVAVIMTRLDADFASSLLGLIDVDLGKQVVIRLAKPMPVRREALRVLEDAIERDFLAPARAAAKASKPGQMIGAMLNNMPEEKRAAMLEFIAAESPEVLEDVKAFILTFKDIPERVPANAIAKVVREVEVDVFLKAAKYGKQNAPESVEFIFKNISQRMGQQYEEQMGEMKPFTLAEAEAAQAEFMTALRRLVAAGEFELVKPASDEPDEEVYV
ncbi:MAG: FliG C-terminal domain-containing protein [Pseudomonadota bacterium]|nr:FliG C-terminal domain-containing protein [Pseudomonadota bacterium]